MLTFEVGAFAETGIILLEKRHWVGDREEEWKNSEELHFLWTDNAISLSVS